MYSETNNANETKIAFDNRGFYTDKTCFIITSKTVDIAKLYRVLSSNVFTWYMKNKSPLLGTMGISLTKDLVETFPCVKDDVETIYDGYHLTNTEIDYIKNELKDKASTSSFVK